MGIFDGFKLVGNVTKAVKEVKAACEENSAIGDKIQEILADLISILEKIKDLVPAVDKAIESIVEIIKKWFKK